MQKQTSKCSGCETSVEQKYFKVLIVDKDLQCECGTDWIQEDLIYCSRGCMKKNCYWQLFNNNSLTIHDECHGCGRNLVFDVDVTIEKK